MSDASKPKGRPSRQADLVFKNAERDKTVREETSRELVSQREKTERLRALRLAEAGKAPKKR
jgi:hypothetical protein